MQIYSLQSLSLSGRTLRKRRMTFPFVSPLKAGKGVPLGLLSLVNGHLQRWAPI